MPGTRASASRDGRLSAEPALPLQHYGGSAAGHVPELHGPDRLHGLRVPASLNVHREPVLIGLVVSSAFVILDGSAPFGIGKISNAAQTTITDYGPAISDHHAVDEPDCRRLGRHDLGIALPAGRDGPVRWRAGDERRRRSRLDHVLHAAGQPRPGGRPRPEPGRQHGRPRRRIHLRRDADAHRNRASRRRPRDAMIVTGSRLHAGPRRHVSAACPPTVGTSRPPRSGSSCRRARSARRRSS